MDFERIMVRTQILVRCKAFGASQANPFAVAISGHVVNVIWREVVGR